MIIKCDESQQYLVLRRLLENKNLVIGLDAAKGEDKCVEATLCVRNNGEILTVETLKIKE